MEGRRPNFDQKQADIPSNSPEKPAFRESEPFFADQLGHFYRMKEIASRTPNPNQKDIDWIDKQIKYLEDKVELGDLHERKN